MIHEERFSKKDETLSKEEECDYYKQKCKVLKALNDKHQEDLMTCKIKIKGIDSLTLLLKESKQEKVILQKNNKSLESAVKNLQRRLAKNGLSSSPTLQDTELFIPGASKQTLDNLAKENVRLRNLLLKNGNGQSEKNPTSELDEIKAANEKLVSENNLLKQDIETYKQKGADLTNKRDEEKVPIQPDEKGDEANKDKVDSGREVTKLSVACQASELKAEAVSELRDVLKLAVRHCSRLDEQLQNSLEISQVSEGAKVDDSNLKMPVLVDEDYQKLREQLEEAQIMNQRWQVYSQTQAKNIQTMEKNHERNIAVFSAAHQEEIQHFKATIAFKYNEIQDAKRQAISLSKEVEEFRSRVELYKEQIRVCTEDFNKEKQDREQAANRAKALLTANGKLKAELDRLKLLNNAELMSRLQQPVHVNHQNIQQRRYELVQERGSSGQVIPGNQLEYNATQLPMSMPQQAMSAAPSLSPHVLLDYNNRMLRNHSSNSSPPLEGITYESQSLPRRVLNDPNLPSYEASTENNMMKNNLSMPVLGRRSGSADGQLLACPKCNKEFPEKSSADLLTHIDLCNA